MSALAVAVLLGGACLSLLPPGARAGSPLAPAPAAQSKPASSRQSSSKRHQATGEIVSVNSAELILLHARGRSRQRMVFALTPETSGRSELAKGKRVTVYYREMEGRLIALRVRSPRSERSGPVSPAKKPG